MSGGLHVLAFSPGWPNIWQADLGKFYEVPQQEPQGERAAALWDSLDGTHLRRILTGFRQGITALSYSPDGQSLVVGMHGPDCPLLRHPNLDTLLEPLWLKIL